MTSQAGSSATPARAGNACLPQCSASGDSTLAPNRLTVSFRLPSSHQIARPETGGARQACSCHGWLQHPQGACQRLEGTWLGHKA